MSFDREHRKRVDALFAQALDLDETSRVAFLDEATVNEPSLRAELEELLQLAIAPAPQLEPQALAQGPLWQALIDDAADDAAAQTGSPPDPIDDRRVGAWQPRHELGRGGMGTVYLAERISGEFEQRGALKLIRPGIDSDEFLQRFAQERQILASLDHPGIARLLDGGRDEQARPYLVMEYVRGEPIDRYCDARRLDIERRLALFVQIGQAVAHAHRHLVVHRDLKPSNIVVTAEGAVKLLDFGIAKVLSGAEIAQPALTRTFARVFTPEYAAPEQITGQAAATTTDVYQLGLLLYDLLTGHRAQAIDSDSPAEWERVICRTEPVRPSQRIADDDRALAEARDSTPSALRRMLRGDLDTIVLKALRKEPERRYDSAAALIDDIERWRQGQPIRARPETFGYRTGKFMRRHPFGVSTAAAALVLLVSYAATVTWQANAIAHERDRARAEAAKAQQVKALVLKLFEGADPELSGGAQLSARELLDRGWAGIEAGLRGQPEVRIELLDTIGEAYRQLGEYDRAEPMFEQALASARPLTATQPLLLARALRSQGRLQADQGNAEEAVALQRQALAAYRVLHEDHPEIATTLSDLGLAFSHNGDYPAAEASYRDSLALRRRLFGEEHPDVADSLNELGIVLRRKGEYAAAAPVLAQALALRRKLLPATHPQVARNLSDLALVRTNLGEYDSAEALYREALALMTQARGTRHPQVATVMNNLAQLQFTRGDYPSALALLRQSLDLRRNLLGEQHPTVALNLNDLGRTLAESGDLAGAESAYQQALSAYPADHPWRAATVFNQGRLAEARGDFRGAERHYRDALARQRKQYGEEHDRVATDLYRLGIAVYRQGRLQEAETHLQQALAIYRKRLPAQHPQLAEILMSLGSLLIDHRRPDEAEALLREAEQIRLKLFGRADARTREVTNALAKARRQP